MAIPWVERRTGLQSAASQREAVSTALSSKVVVARGELLIRRVPVLTEMWQNWLNPHRAIGL
jgi:hypothetical protein